MNEFIKQKEYNNKSFAAIEQAQKDCMLVIFPEINQLFIDIDSKENMTIYERNKSILNDYFRIKEEKIQLSKSGGDHYHITITLGKNLVSDMERILLQACLGSDGKREQLGYQRVLNRDEHPTLFIEDPLGTSSTISTSHQLTEGVTNVNNDIIW